MGVNQVTCTRSRKGEIIPESFRFADESSFFLVEIKVFNLHFKQSFLDELQKLIPPQKATTNKQIITFSFMIIPPFTLLSFDL